MELKLNGCTRIVLLVGNWAIKIPNFCYSMDHFLKGCLANWNERSYYKSFIKCKYKGNMAKHAAPSLFCFWFGLFQIQVRCKPLKRDLTNKEKRFFTPLCGTDNKRQNFGILNGNIVCLDYA
ncbi:hypothetical protein [Paenimyroides ceti]